MQTHLQGTNKIQKRAVNLETMAFQCDFIYFKDKICIIINVKHLTVQKRVKPLI